MRHILKSLDRALSALFTRPRPQSSEPSPIPGPRPLSWSEILEAADVPNVIPGCDACHMLGRPCVEHRNLPRSFGKRKVGKHAALAMQYGRSTVDDLNKAISESNYASVIAEDVAGRRWRPRDADGFKFATLWNDPKAHACAPTSDAISTREAAMSAAATTLQRLGWSWRGGVEWRPPMGPMPDFDLLDKLKSEYEERLAVLDSKRQDLEERLRLAEARAEVREASCLETARLLGENEGWKRRAREHEDIANGAINFISWLRFGYVDNGHPAALADIIEAWQEHEEKIIAIVEEWASEPIAEERKRGDELAAAIILAIEKGGEADSWLTDYNEGHPAALAELHKWRVENGDTGAAAMQGAAVVGRNGLPDVPVAVGRERPGAAPVQPGGEGYGSPHHNAANTTHGASAGDIRPVREELNPEREYIDGFMRSNGLC